MLAVEKRTRLGARLLIKAAKAPLSRPRDIRVAERLSSLEICDDSLYESIFAKLGYPSFQPWSTPSPAKALWKTLGGRPTHAEVREALKNRLTKKEFPKTSMDWLYLPHDEFQKRLAGVS